jgi:hypothetical protein
VQAQLIDLRDQLLARSAWTAEDASRCASLTRGLAAALASQSEAARAYVAALPESRTPQAHTMQLELLRQVALRIEPRLAQPPAIAAAWARPSSDTPVEHELQLAAWRAAAAFGVRAEEAVLQRHGVQLAQAARGAFGGTGA